MAGWTRIAAAALALGLSAVSAAAQQADSVFSRFSPQMRAAVPSAQALTAMNQQLALQAGVETEVISERIVDPPPAPGMTMYVRTARWDKTPVMLDLMIVIDSAGTIMGMNLSPQRSSGPAPTEFAEYQTRTPLRLPFDGEWFVYWGGRTVEQNYHAAHHDQRFAYDMYVRRDGASHTGDGTRLEQYHCWGQPILAPGDGTVVTAVDSLADQQIGQRDPRNVAGNHVILDHGNGEFSLLAHLQRGSVAVRAGERVRQGQRLGACGNSGNTSEPHLHYHLQNGPVFGRAAGLPAQFNGYAADGHPVTRGEPLKGQTVRHQP
ncbi:MAG TPA: M23 family metallopeptidase [Armatimonadota bacterium]|nr:M23 family metallopeptidase [Armatimonadota bacterium]